MQGPGPVRFLAGKGMRMFSCNCPCSTLVCLYRTRANTHTLVIIHILSAPIWMSLFYVDFFTGKEVAKWPPCDRDECLVTLCFLFFRALFISSSVLVDRFLCFSLLLLPRSFAMLPQYRENARKKFEEGLSRAINKMSTFSVCHASAQAPTVSDTVSKISIQRC